ncbi:hypothetical protein BR93DRAFT_795567 [Coniochaeta sp. PMI_546]|nr:hypothetical protein BR93DRAFT_795567 [Coniochaeta sp. PMI_546]
MAKWLFMRWMRRRRAKPERPPRSSPVDGPAPRFASCDILYSAGIPFCIWSEDALSHVGVPTIVFELFLLVPDVDLAAQKLVDAGYERRGPPLAYEPIPQFHNLFAPAQSSKHSAAPEDEEVWGFIDSADTPVALLPAKDWFYDLPEKPEDMTDWYPTLDQLLVALIAKWLDLDAQESTLRLRIAVFIGYIYHYLDAVKEQGFENKIPRQYWRFHFDQVQGTTAGDIGTAQCQMDYLDMIRETEIETSGKQKVQQRESDFPSITLREQANITIT